MQVMLPVKCVHSRFCHVEFDIETVCIHFAVCTSTCYVLCFDNRPNINIYYTLLIQTTSCYGSLLLLFYVHAGDVAS